MKVHPRQQRGSRATDPDDYPAEKTAYALRAPGRFARPGSAFDHRSAVLQEATA